ncbi:MAG: response regulator [Deltaproteobacteria bacterium]|nr:response regulator [Deltaproteobacteria bacterium]
MKNNQKTIFIIEDNPDLNDLISYNLNKKGYKVIKSFSGLDAIWKTATLTRPDCILLDLMMPSPNGFEICDFIKSSEDYRDIPIIIVSARSSAEDIEQALTLGADAYLKKPFSIQTLLQLIETHSSPTGKVRASA